MQEQSEMNDADERRALSERLRQAREHIGLNQEEVARILKLPRTAVTAIESGQRKVEATELKKLATIYRQPISYLTGERNSERELPADVAHMARAASELSQDDRKELSQFAEYLRTRSTIKRSV